MGLLTALATAIVDFIESNPGTPADLLYLVAAGLPVTLAHELGHAVVARHLLGSGVRVVVGRSGRVADVRVLGISVQLNALAHPARIAGYAETDATHATPRDIAVIAAAGPAASFVGFVITASAYSVAAADGVLHDALWALTLAGAFGWLLNLVPMTVLERRDGPAFRTDGRLILDALRASRMTTSHRGARLSPTSTTTSTVTSAPGHLPLRGRAGTPLGVEPITRTTRPDPADDGLARRARRLSANRGRSVPPPGR